MPREIHTIERLSHEAFGWYLAGFTDGEGCFSLAEKRSKRLDGSERHRWEAAFTIGMRADEEPILCAIQSRLGCGIITSCCKNGGNNPATRYVVSSIRELATIIVPQFEAFGLQAKKAQDFAIWKQAVQHLREMSLRPKSQWKRGDRLATPADDAILADLFQRLRDVRKFQAVKLAVHKEDANVA